MPPLARQNSKNWTVAEAKAKLSEVLRLAAEEGPQLIGRQKPFVVVPRKVWDAATGGGDSRKPLGRWLVDNVPRGGVLETPDRGEPDREPPFRDAGVG